MIVNKYHYKFIDQLRKESTIVSNLAKRKAEFGIPLSKSDPLLENLEYLDQCQPVFYDLYGREIFQNNWLDTVDLIFPEQFKVSM